MSRNIELQKFVRWMILRMLYTARPDGASEIIILRVLQSMELDCELDYVRQDMDYMRSVGLAEAGQDDLTRCRARLTALGVAVVEYSARAPSGIGRPRRCRSSNKDDAAVNGGGTGINVGDVAPEYAVDQRGKFVRSSGYCGGLAGMRRQTPIKSTERAGSAHEAYCVAAQGRGCTISRRLRAGAEQRLRRRE